MKTDKYIVVDGKGRYYRTCESYTKASALCRTSRGTSWNGPSPLFIDYAASERAHKRALRNAG